MLFLPRSTKCRRNPIRSLSTSISFVLFRWHQRIHFYVFVLVLFIAVLVSLHLPFGLLFNWRFIVPERPSIEPVRNRIIAQQKQAQQFAFEWLDHLWKNARNFPSIISNQTGASRFYDLMSPAPNRSPLSTYELFDKSKRSAWHNSTPTDEHVVISILYSRQNTDHREGTFYVGQLLHHLLRTHHSRFIITLCENNNTSERVSDDIDLIRRLVPVFVVNARAAAADENVDMYEQEKQAHLQCILANFQSFRQMNHLLLLQDDAPPIGEDFYVRLSSLIDNRLKKQWPLDGVRQQPAFLKIYHPRWLIDYLHPSLYIIVQLIATSLFLTFTLFALFHAFQVIRQDVHNYIRDVKHLRWDHTLLVVLHHHTELIYRVIFIQFNPVFFALYFVLITLVLLLLNHSNVSWTWRSLHSSLYAIYPAPSCCLPGVIFFRETYSQVIDYLNRTVCSHSYAIDTAFDDLPKRTHLQTYLVEPNLVHHIGLYSRLRHIYINPYLLD